jgi:hypothetical protein
MGAIMAEPGSFGSEANNNFHCWPLLFVFARVVNNKGLFFFDDVSAFGDSLFVSRNAAGQVPKKQAKRAGNPAVGGTAGYCRASPQQP